MDIKILLRAEKIVGAFGLSLSMSADVAEEIARLETEPGPAAAPILSACMAALEGILSLSDVAAPSEEAARAISKTALTTLVARQTEGGGV